MKILKHNRLFCLIILISLQGCMNEVVQEAFLIDAEITLPYNPPITHYSINKKVGEAAITPVLMFSPTGNSNPSLTPNYFDKSNFPDTLTTRQKYNSNINSTNFVIGLDYDMAFNEHLAGFYSVRFTKKDKTELWNFTVGTGFFSSQPDFAFRIDAGIMYQQYYYSANSIVFDYEGKKDNTPERVNYYSAEGRNYSLFPFVNASIQKAIINDIAAVFLTTGYFRSEVINFQPVEGKVLHYLSGTSEISASDTEIKNYAGFFYLNPGIVMLFDANIRITASAYLMKEIELDKADENWIFQPAMMFSISF